MTFEEYANNPQSKKITVVEIDAPLAAEAWINYEPGIWFTRLSPGDALVEDDNGNTGYWQGQNTQYLNIQSLAVNGLLYAEELALIDCIGTEKTWYYDEGTTDFYIHFEDWNPPWFYTLVVLGAAIGFTNQIDKTVKNYFEDIYYEPLLLSVPNLSKKKDALFFGILQYQGGGMSFDNTDGYFDDFANLDLYGQPVRIRLSFEGLPLDDQLLVYSGKVEDFSHDFSTFNLEVADIRKLLSRKYPINVFDSTTYPSMDSKLIGTPIPIAFGSIIKAPAYKTAAGSWKFCDTTFNAVDSGILVQKEDGQTFAHTGTGVGGTFTGTDTDDKLVVTFSVSVVENGLDIISDILENYENIDFNNNNYDTTEWNAEKANVPDSGIWIGKGNLMSSVDVIEQVCVDSNGIFDVLVDGRFTFRTYDANRASSSEYLEDEVMNIPTIEYDAEEYLSSAKIEHSKDWLTKEPELFTNDTEESEVYARYRQYKERSFSTTLTNAADAEALSDEIMEQSKLIKPKIDLLTKTQKIGIRILDNITYEYKRRNGKVIVNNALYQVLGVDLNMSSYEITTSIKYIKDV
jgi:hypothetical protein